MTAAPTLAPGTRLVSTQCSTQVIVVRSPRTSVHITCGGAPMEILGATEPRTLGPVPPRSLGVQRGKRYSDPESGLELLCTQGGTGPIAVADRELNLLHF